MKHMQKKIITIAVLSLLMGVSTANAELIIEDSNSTARVSGTSTATQTTPTITNVTPKTFEMKKAAYVSKNVTEEGIRNVGAPIDGWGDNIELSIVLKQIVPSDWKEPKQQNFMDMDKKISWKSNGDNWFDVLGKIADQNNFKAHVNWNNKQITLTGNGQTIVTSNVVRKTSEPLKPIANSNLRLKPINMDIKPVVAVPEQQVWILKKEKSLRKNIEEWAEKSNRIVAWNTPIDYNIISDITLKGKLDQVGGPLDVITKSYRNADQPIKLKLYKGNDKEVIEVSDLVSEQETVIQRSISQDYNSMQ